MDAQKRGVRFGYNSAKNTVITANQTRWQNCSRRKKDFAINIGYERGDNRTVFCCKPCVLTVMQKRIVMRFLIT